MEYLETVVATRREFDSRFKSNYDFFNHRSGIPIDFIGRFESFNRDAMRVFKQLNILAEVPRKNVGPTRDYSKIVGLKEKNWIRENFADDFAEFGYLT